MVLVRDGKEFDLTEKTLHTLRVQLFNLGHVFGRDCIQLKPFVFLFLVQRGDGVIRMMGVIILLRSGLGLGNSLGFVQAHVSRFARFQSHFGTRAIVDRVFTLQQCRLRVEMASLGFFVRTGRLCDVAFSLFGGSGWRTRRTPELSLWLCWFRR